MLSFELIPTKSYQNKETIQYQNDSISMIQYHNNNGININMTFTLETVLFRNTSIQKISHGVGVPRIFTLTRPDYNIPAWQTREVNNTKDGRAVKHQDKNEFFSQMKAEIRKHKIDWGNLKYFWKHKSWKLIGKNKEFNKSKWKYKSIIFIRRGELRLG